MGITKTDFMRGMQCRKMLWLDKHRPDLKIIPPEIQQKLDAGNEFGDRAMGIFGEYEEMTVYRPGTQIPDKKAMASRTAEHLEKGTAVICEAAFIYYNNYCAVDILKKTENGYDFYEVKNAGEVRKQFLRDAAFQYYILSRCKINDHIWDLNRMQKQPEEVDVCPGEQCMEPYECWYYEYCHGESINKN